MKRLSTRWNPLALAAACAVLTAPLFAAEIPGNLGYGLDKLVEDSLTLKANPQAPTPYGGYTTEAAASYAADAIMDEPTGRVLVDILPNGKLSAPKLQTLLEGKIKSLSIVAVDAEYRHTGILEGYVAVDDVPALAQITGVRSVFLALKPEQGSVGTPDPSVMPGDVLNKLGTAFDQGVTQHRVDRINQYYNPNAIVNYDGAGISVAVISDSFGSRYVGGVPATPTVATDMANFDLPGGAANPLNTTPVYVYRDEPAGSGTDEGRGMAQIVYKMAPRAKVAFFSGAYGEVQFANDIRALAAGVTGGPSGSFKADVMVDDLSYGGEPYFGETIIGNAIDDATTHGLSYFSSAGNNIGINAYESALRLVPDGSAGGTLLTAAAGNAALAGTNINLAGVPVGLYAGGLHNFNPTSGQRDVAQLVNMPTGSPGSTEMQWDDPYDQRPAQPAVPPVFSANASSSGGASVTFDASSSPALPPFNMGTRYVIKESATWGSFDGEVQIYDAGNNLLLDQDTVVDEVVYFDPPSTGQYKIVILPCCGTSGDFTLTVTTPLFAANGTTNATFDGGSVPALPTFTAGTTYTIEETAFSGTMDGIVTIKDPSNATIVTQDTGTDEVVTFTAPSSGQYTIQVAPFSTTSGNFHLVVYTSFPPTGVSTDLNLLVFDTSGNYLSTKSLVSNNLANNRPVELGGNSTVSSPAGQNQLQFVIARANIPAPGAQLPTRVRWSTRGNGAANIGPAEYFTYNATTTKGHATAKGCNGTAAYSVFRANTPEVFTSPGPATIMFDKDANRLAVPDIRQVPRVAAADAANSTWSAVGDSASDPDANPNFSGTSAAAPHAAAIAALVLQANGGPGSVSPAVMRSILQANVFPHDLDPSAASAVANTSDGGTVTITISSDNDNNVATGMNDPNSISVSYLGAGSLASLTFNPQGSASTAGRPTSGLNGVQDGVPGTVSYFENDYPGMMFRPATTIQSAPFVIPARGFTLGTLTGLTAADIDAPTAAPLHGFSNPAPAPATATDFWTMSIGFPTGQFTHGKQMHFTVGRGAQRSSSLAAGGSTTLSALADLIGGGVMIPNGMTIADGMTFSGTTTSGGTFSGTIKNQIGYGWTPVDGFGFIDAAAATGAGATTLVSSALASPAAAPVGGNTLLTVTVTPGASPASTGLYVAANLEAIGGDPAQKFYDDGTNGDAVAGDNVFSYSTTVGAAATSGGKSMQAVVADLQGRGGSTLINFTVSTFTSPTGIGAATPSSVAPTDSTLLTVQVTPGASPPSTGLSVTADLTSIGGGAAQQFFDDGSNGDVTAGDNMFSYSAAVALATTPGAKILPATITDAQGRSGSANISLTVLTPTALSATASASPDSGIVGSASLFSVTVTAGTDPASTGITVAADLTDFGGAAAQAFTDNGGGSFSFNAIVQASAATGLHVIPVSITDAQGRTASTSIAFNVIASGALSGVGLAIPNSVGLAGSTTLLVSVTPGTDPDSTGITVVVDLSSIGGSATQTFYDDGSNGDQTAGDNIFTYVATVASNTSLGAKLMPATIADTQGRSVSANVSLTVVQGSDVIFVSGFEQ